MSIGTYAELKTAVGAWRERVGEAVITANVADCIALGEAELNRLLMLSRMWVNGDLTGTDGDRELELPADYYAEPKWLKLTTSSQFTELAKSTPEGMQYFSTSSSTPEEWCVNGDHIDLNRPCSGALTFQFRYRSKFQLSDTNTTNWLLTNHPDIYLGATLLWSGLLLLADDINYWEPRTLRAIEQLKILDARSNADVPLQVDPGLIRNNRNSMINSSSSTNWWVS